MEFDDWLEIVQLKYSYCAAIDGPDHDAWAATFTEDAHFDRGDEDPLIGRETLREYARDVIPKKYRRTVHIVTNPIIDVDGDTATGRWKLYNVYEDREGEVYRRHGGYEETYRRVEGSWLIAETAVDHGIGYD